jgi:hypothetical protein
MLERALDAGRPEDVTPPMPPPAIVEPAEENGPVPRSKGGNTAIVIKSVFLIRRAGGFRKPSGSSSTAFRPAGATARLTCHRSLPARYSAGTSAGTAVARYSAPAGPGESPNSPLTDSAGCLAVVDSSAMVHGLMGFNADVPGETSHELLGSEGWGRRVAFVAGFGSRLALNAAPDPPISKHSRKQIHVSESTEVKPRAA